MNFTYTNLQSASLKIHEIILNSGKILAGYVLYLMAGAYIFMLCERENEVMSPLNFVSILNFCFTVFEP